MAISRFKISECTLSLGNYNDLAQGYCRDKKDIINCFIESEIRFIEVGLLSNVTHQLSNMHYISAEIPFLEDKKDVGVLYSMLIEEIDEYNLRYLVENGSRTVDVIRVKLRKKKIDETIDYCKEIQKKGYKVSVILVDFWHYEKKEFSELLRECAEADFWGICINDDEGCCDAQLISDYIDIVCSNTKDSICLGLQINMTQISLECLLRMESVGTIGRDIYLDTVIYGIGHEKKYARTEVAINLLSEQRYQMRPIIRLIDEQFHDIERVSGMPTYYYMASFMKVSAKYINYLTKKEELYLEEVYDLLETLTIEEKENYIGNKKVDNYLLNYRKKKWERKLGVIVIVDKLTRNFKIFFDAVENAFENFGIDLVIADISSTSELFEYIHQCAGAEKETGIIYNRVDVGDNYGNTKNIMKVVFNKCTSKYEYVLVVRSEVIPIASIVVKCFKKWYAKTPDLFVLHNQFGVMETKEYTKTVDFFVNNCKKMAVEQMIIFRRDFLKKIFESMEENYSLGEFWYSLSCFKCWNEEKTEIVEVNGTCYYCNHLKSDSRFWNKHENTLFHWTEEWISAINSLPDYLEEYKEECYNLDTDFFQPYSLDGLLKMRASKKITYFKVKKYEKYLRMVTKTEYENILNASLLLPMFARQAIRRPVGFCAHRINSKFERIAKKHKNEVIEKKEIDILSETMNDDFIASKKWNFADNQLCLAIPTANRAEVLDECLEWMLEIYANYNVDVIILDSSNNDETQNVVLKYRNLGYKNIYHEWYKGKYDPLSIDDKVIYGYKLLAEKYQYIWMIRDRILVRFDKIFFEIQAAIDKNMDFIILHDYNAKHPITYSKEYDDCNELFKEQFCEMTVLGITIIKSTTIKEIIKTIPVDAVKNYTLWQPIAFFDYIASRGFKAIVYICKVFDYHPSAYATGGGSFWLKFYLWQWAERFFTMMSQLPETYGRNRIKVMNENIRHFNLYSMWFVIAARGKGGITLKSIKEYEKSIQMVSPVSMKMFYLLAVTPKWICRLIIKHPIILNPVRKRWNKKKEIGDGGKTLTDYILG